MLAETAASRGGAASAKAQVFEIAENDLPAVEAFIRSQKAASPVSSDTPSDAPRHQSKLEWFLLENPARRPDVPLGWQIRTAKGDLCGAMLCGPQDFCQGNRHFTLLLSSDFYVSEESRGAGLAIFLRYLRLGSRHALFAVTANRQSGSLWQKFGGQGIPGTDHEMIGMWNVRPAVEEALWRNPAVKVIARAVAAASPLAQAFYRLKQANDGGELVRLDRPEEVSDLRLPPDPEHLSAAHSPEYVRWRYFSREAGTETYRYRSQSGTGDYFVAVKITRRGYRGQFRALTVLDVRPKPGARMLLSLAGCLARVHRKDADGIVFRCAGPEEQEALARAGFRRKAFEGPSAWWLDKGVHLPSVPWYVVPADGDMMM
jgi:hypothetical protein